MKISLQPYQPSWQEDFENIKTALVDALDFLKPAIEHIGSTAVTGLSAKPIIDILVGVTAGDDLDRVVVPLCRQGYDYYELYNNVMPYRRFFVKHKNHGVFAGRGAVIKTDAAIPRNTNEHKQRQAHIHVMLYNSVHWTRHIAFRNYLRVHPAVSQAYQQLKEQLVELEWKDGNDYNKAKNVFLQKEEEAMAWHYKIHSTTRN